jgi:thiamine kinase-like enzyme
MGNRYRVLAPAMAELERERGGTDPVPKLVPDGWRRMFEEAPDAARIVRPLLDEPAPLVNALERGPQTLVHSDWKAGNLGSGPDGRTILIDWAWPGRAPPTVDLAWYLAVNCDLLPQSKEEAIDVYREALEHRGISTGGWWEPQLELALLGALVQLGWSKTGDELAWWDERVRRGRGLLTDA